MPLEVVHIIFNLLHLLKRYDLLTFIYALPNIMAASFQSVARVSIRYKNKQFRFRKQNITSSMIKAAFELDDEFEIMLHNSNMNYVEFPDKDGSFILDLDRYEVIIVNKFNKNQSNIYPS